MAGPGDQRRTGRRGSPVLEDGVHRLLDGCCGGAGAGAGGGARDVLDLGGGTGGLAVALAEQGHRVVVVDPSPDALAALERRAAEAGCTDRVRAVQGDAAALLDVVEPASVDLLLCHGVLEVVDDPAAALAAARAVLRPQGRLSLLVAQWPAVLLQRALGGHFAQARAVVDDPDHRWGAADPLLRRYDAASARAAVEDAGFRVLEVEGVRVVADLVPSALAEADAAAVEGLESLERAIATRAELQPLAGALHLHAAPAG